MDKFKVTPQNSKERTRIAEHGDIWETSTAPHVSQTDRSLLSSVKTGYVRWWNNSQIETVAESTTN